MDIQTGKGIFCLLWVNLAVAGLGVLVLLAVGGCLRNSSFAFSTADLSVQPWLGFFATCNGANSIRFWRRDDADIAECC
jgi:hypothetical protein